MTDDGVRNYERSLLKECLEDAEKVAGSHSPASVAFLAAALFGFRRETHKL